MKNIAASVQDRLKNSAREQGTPFNILLEHFALGRLFARLSQSPYSDKFVLKGAQLFRIWSNSLHRPTRDADFLSFGSAESEVLAAVFDSICQLMPTEPDALTWHPAVAAPIRDENAYGGVRIKIIAQLGNMRIPLQIDVGFGDAVTPDTQPQVWSSLLDFDDIPMITYPVETVIAEKFEAMVSLGMANSRMKDFFDLHWISQHKELSFATVSAALTNTFERRGSVIPANIPVALSLEFSKDAHKAAQWKAFLRKNKLPQQDLHKVTEQLHYFLLPLLSVEPSTFTTWNSVKGWHTPNK